jgi:hypothetical protein
MTVVHFFLSHLQCNRWMHYVFLIKKIQYQCIYLGTSEKKNRPSKKKIFKETYSQVSETQVGRPLDKYNNKITELRTILQRESQNS